MASAPTGTRVWSKAHGERLRRLRTDRGLTRSALARLLTMSADSVDGWEKGEHQPRDQNLRDLAGRLGVKVDFLLAPFSVEIPPFGRTGITLFRALPVASRASLVMTPIVEQLRSAGFDHFILESFDLPYFWVEFGALLGRQLEGTLGQRFELLRWARGEGPPRALVLSGFYYPIDGPDLKKCESEWMEYLRLIKSVQPYCQVVLIQAINPLHFDVPFRSGSWRDLKPRRVNLPLDAEPARFAYDLLCELPSCCLESLRCVLASSADPERPLCLANLVDSGILQEIDEGQYDLIHEACKELWKARLQV